jgi:putative chitinase
MERADRPLVLDRGAHHQPVRRRLNMGRVNAAIGYPAGAEDGRRCDSSRTRLRYLTGSVPAGVVCARSKQYAGDTSRLGRAEFDALGKTSGGLG